MNESPNGIESGRRVYADLLRAQTTRTNTSTFSRAIRTITWTGFFNTAYWKQNGGVLPGWIVGDLGSGAYALPPIPPMRTGALMNVYGSLVGTVQPTVKSALNLRSSRADIPNR